MRQIISTAVAAFVLTACAAPAAGPRIANNPCDDPAYRALKAQPVDSLSQREFQQMQQGDAACAQVAAVLAASANDAPRGPEPRIDTDAWTQAMSNESGQEIHIRNTSNVPIIVTEVTLNSCINLADACGRHFPRVRINVGDVRRVLRVRYGTGTITSSFQYSYRGARGSRAELSLRRRQGRMNSLQRLHEDRLRGLSDVEVGRAAVHVAG